ncbi:MAG: peptidylprolyl isomerase [Bradymonadaceae bacterium]
MDVSDDCIVEISYELEDESGDVLERVPSDSPLPYLHGHQNIIPGLEEVLDGLGEGDEFDVEVPPEKAYGEYVEGLVNTLDRSEFPDDVDLEPGMQFQVVAEDEEGEEADEESVQVWTIKKIAGDDVEVDANHPLAGRTLVYRGTVEGVREADETELEQGYPAQE